MTYRTSIVVSFKGDPRHGGTPGVYYIAVRKRRGRCGVCRHHHGASRNHRPERCRVPRCHCSHMLNWAWINPPWLKPKGLIPTLPIRRRRDPLSP